MDSDEMREMGLWLNTMFGLAAMVWAAAATAQQVADVRRDEAVQASPSASQYRDEVTAAQVTDLTPDMTRALVTYQTHPMWTAGMDYLLFQGERDGEMSPHALHVASGEVRCLVASGAGSCVLGSESGRLYYLSGRELRALDVAAAFHGDGEPSVIAELPAEVSSAAGGVSLDAGGGALYAGAVLEEDERWALLALDLAKRHWRTVMALDSRIGHVQANPVVSGVVMFCHETGGDAPQRMWVVDAKDASPRPFYKETYGEWVTHEAWWGGDRAAFTIWPYDDEHRRKPHGAVSADLATGTLTVHAQFPAWHIHGRPDGKWLVADDMDRNIWLIRREDGERRLLTQGHLGQGFKTHPHPSFTPDGTGVVFSSSRNGAEHVFLAAIPQWTSLPLP